MEPPAPRLRERLASHGISVTADRAEQAFRAEIAYYLANHVQGHDSRSLEELRDRCAEVLRDALGEPSLDLATARTAMLGAITFSAYPDAADALRALRARGVRLVVASNWDCSLPRVLTEAGLTVDAVLTSAQVGAAKPDARFFEAALGVARCAAAEAVYVGDSPRNDVGGATAAGIPAVLVRRGARIDQLEAEPAPAVPAIERLTELPSLLFDERGP